MNAFRIYFLVIVLVGGFALALARMAPAAVAEQNRQTLVERARLESVFIAQAEQLRVASRARAAAMVAADPEVIAFVKASPEERDDAAFEAAVARVRAPGIRTAETVLLVDRSGAVQALLGGSRTEDTNTWASRSRAAQALSGSGVTTYFTLMGEMFASRAEPVVDLDGAIIGAVVVADEYDSASVASWRSSPGTHSALFVGLEVFASNIADTALAADVGGVVRRTTQADMGTAGRLELRDVREIDDRLAVIAPVHLGDPNSDYASGATTIGVMVVVDGERIPSNLPAVLVRMKAFDEGAGVIWIALVGSLLVFFAGLTLLERSLGSSVRRLARRIGGSATENDPTALPLSDYRPWLRPVAEAFNGFLEAYRTASPGARRTRAESSAHLFKVDASKPGRPATLLTREDSASDSVSESGPHRVSPSTDVVPASASAERASATSFEHAELASDDDMFAAATAEGPGLFRVDTGAHAMSVDSEPEADEPPAEDTPAEEPPAEDTPIEDTPAQEAPAQEATDTSVPELAEEPAAAAEADLAAAPESAFKPLELPAARSKGAPRGPHEEEGRSALVSAKAPLVGDGVLSGAKAAQDEDWTSLMQDFALEISGANAAVGEDKAPEPDSGLELSADVRPVAFEPEPDTAALDAVAELSPAAIAAEARAPRSAPEVPPSGPDTVRAQPVVESKPSAEVSPATPAEDADSVSEFERESESTESESIVDPQQSRTVPRVSLNELNARARGRVEESGEQQALLAAAEKRLRELQSGASHAQGATSSSEDDAGLEPSHRALFDEFHAAKLGAGEDVSRLTYAKFLQKLERNANALKARYKCSDVRFEVSVRNDKVTLKATPIR